METNASIIEISVANDFSNTPGGRYRSAGPYSGEEFREDFLEPMFNNLKQDQKIKVELDGCYGYPVSFLEEVFGGMIRKFDTNKVIECILYHCSDEPSVESKIKQYINDAVKQKKEK